MGRFMDDVAELISIEKRRDTDREAAGRILGRLTDAAVGIREEWEQMNGILPDDTKTFKRRRLIIVAILLMHSPETVICRKAMPKGLRKAITEATGVAPSVVSQIAGDSLFLLTQCRPFRAQLDGVLDAFMGMRARRGETEGGVGNG